MTKLTRLVAAGALAAGVAVPMSAHVAGADPVCPPYGPPCQVGGEELSRVQTTPKVAPTQVAAKTATKVAGTSTSTLPFTGADVVELTLIGLGAVGAGTILVRRSKRATNA